ncbi:hypothetical protein BDZ45DRAFT_809702 [Acephala macrosclerotiorum]|nr:hypothetical protein BDZ45DRAFT_809702 [Acephala macrosclerotiorum]
MDVQSKIPTKIEHSNHESLHEERSATESEQGWERTCNVPIFSPKVSWILPCTAVLLQLAVALLLAIVTFVGVWVQHNAQTTIIQQPVSTSVRLGYVTGVTVLATLISTFISGQIRTLWFRNLLPNTGTESVTVRQRWFATELVGQAGIADKWKTWPVSITFLLSGLITTTIVAGLSFQNVNYNQTYKTIISTQSTFDDPSLQCRVLDSNASSSIFSWKLANGSTLAVGQNTSEVWYCEPQSVKDVFSNTLRTSLFTAADYAYVLGGVPVHQSAVGVPVGLGYDMTPTFGVGIWRTQLSHLQWSRNCLPVLSQNPVQCEVSGNATVSSNAVTVNAGGCTVSTPIYAVDPITEGVTAAGACTEGHEVGTATIVIGSANSHANTLAGIMNGPEWNTSVETYAVACSVDIAPSIAFRSVRYESIGIYDEALSHGTSSAYHIIGDIDGDCEPRSAKYYDASTPSGPVGILNSSRLLTETALATAASASWPLLTEGSYSDGSLETLFNIFNLRGTSGFNNSRNPVEDALGLASAIALGFFWETYQPDLEFEDGVVEFTGVRVGPGKWWAIFYTLPSLFSAAVLMVLIWKTRHTLSFPWEIHRVVRQKE